jgi:hypothetical protein
MNWLSMAGKILTMFIMPRLHYLSKLLAEAFGELDESATVAPVRQWACFPALILYKDKPSNLLASASEGRPSV